MVGLHRIFWGLLSLNTQVRASNFPQGKMEALESIARVFGSVKEMKITRGEKKSKKLKKVLRCSECLHSVPHPNGAWSGSSVG